jgi:hypothetical protein
MTIEQLRTAHQARPFRTFTIHMADGRSLGVPHSEFLSHSASGRTVVVHHADESFSVVDLLLVNEIEVQGPAATPSQPQSRGAAN